MLALLVRQETKVHQYQAGLEKVHQHKPKKTGQGMPEAQGDER